MRERLKGLSLERQNLARRLNTIFALFFLGPVVGILYLVVAHDLAEDRQLPLVLLLLLSFALVGYNILRKLFANLSQLSHGLTESVGAAVQDGNNEIGTIVRAVSHLEASVERNFLALNKKVSDVAALKELSELCYITFDSDDLFYLTLERALKVVDAEIGSVLLLERPGREHFMVQASVGLDEFGQRGRRIPFESSIAKYAVINRAPLRVDDLESDPRFSGRSRPKYGTQAFLIMPLRTMREVLGVVTFSKKRDGKPFTDEDADLLTPLLSTAAFTYDNLLLDKEGRKSARLLETARKIVFLLGSNMKRVETVHAVIDEIRRLIPFEDARVLMVDPEYPGDLIVEHWRGEDRRPEQVQGARFAFLGTLFDRVIRSDTSCSIDLANDALGEMERSLIGEGVRFVHLEPLRFEGRNEGVLVLGSRGDRPYSVEQRDQVTLLSGLLSLAIEETGLRAEVETARREHETMNSLGAALSASASSIEKILEHTLDVVGRSCVAEGACVLMREGDELVFKATRQLDLAILRRTRVKMGQGLAGYCAARGEPVVIGRRLSPKHLTPIIDTVTGFRTRSALAVPVISGGMVVGVIEVLNKMGGEFGEREIRVLQSVASAVSIALENARLYKEIIADTENERAIRKVFERFVPQAVVDKMTRGDGFEGAVDEFKRLTLLNIDIRGFSQLAKLLGPHRSVALLNQFFETMGSIVIRHGGMVDKYLGDGFLALFGAPVATAHDAENAILASLVMRNALVEFNRSVGEEIAGKLRVGIAIHTGDAIVGNIGFEKKMDYTVIGDSVNAVFRLQELTRDYPDSILITEATRRESLSMLSLRKAGRHDIDATEGPLDIYEVLRVHSLQPSGPRARGQTER